LTNNAVDVPEANEPLSSNLSMDEMQQCINLLPDAYRSVFVLYALKGHTHSEIAQILNISIGTSKSNYHKARKKLQSILCDRYKNLSYCKKI